MKRYLPETRDELLAMCACYVLVAALFVMGCAPRQVGEFLIGLVP